jgi:hypothetical protein
MPEEIESSCMQRFFPWISSALVDRRVTSLKFNACVY